MRDWIGATPLINFILGVCALAVVIGVSQWGSLVNVIALVTLALLLAVIVTKLVTQ